MHFVTGGAFQGKRSWVCTAYHINNRVDVKWHSFYEQDDIPRPDQLHSETIIVLEGLEQIIKTLVEERQANIREILSSVFHEWKSWEEADPRRTVIFIGCDISKGIVPMIETERSWRDITGWCYQELASLSRAVDMIWSGLAQTIKKEG